MKNRKDQSVDQITALEISKIDNSNKIQKLEFELKRAEKEIQAYKTKEKQSVRALVLYERKFDYLRKILLKEFEQILNDFNTNKFLTNQSIDKQAKKIEALIDFVKKETNTSFEEKDIVKKTANESIEERFLRLKNQFEEKIGSSVLRGRGRPSKEKQSIVADIGIGGNKSKRNKETKRNQEKIDQIFFTASSGKSAKSNIPQTNDSIFDFDEALNPELSLSDIMNDIENERKDLSKKKEMTTEPMLEAGYISKPKIKK